jgi:hypothetical protein
MPKAAANAAPYGAAVLSALSPLDAQAISGVPRSLAVDRNYSGV